MTRFQVTKEETSMNLTTLGNQSITIRVIGLINRMFVSPAKQMLDIGVIIFVLQISLFHTYLIDWLEFFIYLSNRFSLLCCTVMYICLINSTWTIQINHVQANKFVINVISSYCFFSCSVWNLLIHFNTISVLNR